MQAMELKTIATGVAQAALEARVEEQSAWARILPTRLNELGYNGDITNCNLPTNQTECTPSITRRNACSSGAR